MDQTVARGRAAESGRLQLVCPAGTPASLRAAVEAGADAVYAGFRDATNARNFPGLNFSREELAEGIEFAHAADARVYVAINTFAAAGNTGPWRRAVDDAASLGADAIIVADMGILDYAAHRHPELRRHLSVQASASNSEAIRFYAEVFGVRRVVLPRVLSLADVRRVTAAVPVETEVFAFGGMCVMAEGRCQLSSYLTGRSPNMDGVCAPAENVRYETRGGKLICKLAGYTMDAIPADQPAGYPTPCKGRFVVNGTAQYLFDEPASLNATDLLPDLAAAGVTALKIEGRQRGRSYVSAAVTAFRAAIDNAAQEGEGTVPPVDLGVVSEGGRGTTGAYRKTWR